VDDGQRYVDSQTEGRDDALDDGTDALVVRKSRVRQFAASSALDVDGIWRDDGNGLHRWVREQAIEGTEADRLVGDFSHHGLAVYVRGDFARYLLGDTTDRRNHYRPGRMAIDVLGEHPVNLTADRDVRGQAMPIAARWVRSVRRWHRRVQHAPHSPGLGYRIGNATV
jgi:hypothetical protein